LTSFRASANGQSARNRIVPLLVLQALGPSLCIKVKITALETLFALSITCQTRRLGSMTIHWSVYCQCTCAEQIASDYEAPCHRLPQDWIVRHDSPIRATVSEDMLVVATLTHF